MLFQPNRVNPDMNAMFTEIDAYYTGVDLADGTDLAEDIAIGYAVCWDFYGDPTVDATLGKWGFNVTKPQTENVTRFAGIITRMTRPQAPDEPQLISIGILGPIKKVWTHANMTGRTSLVPAAAATPLAPTADQWYLVAGATSSIDTPTELNTFAGFALATADTSTTSAFHPCFINALGALR